MATRMALWKLNSDGSATALPEERLASEEQIESAVESAPELLGIDILIVGRQKQECLSDRGPGHVPGPGMPYEPKPLTKYPELMTVAEAADYLRIATSTAYLLTQPAAPRRLPAVKVGGRTFILRDRLTEYLQPQP